MPRKGRRRWILAQSRIFLCNSQGVIRTTVNTMEILAPLLDDKSNVLGGRATSPDGDTKADDDEIITSNYSCP